MVLVAPVELLQITIPVAKARPAVGAVYPNGSSAKALITIFGTTPFAGKLAESKS